jgi:hypothetical protein
MPIEVGIDRIEGLEEVRARFGDSGQIGQRMSEVLNQAARIGVHSARIYAPKDKELLVNAITEDSIRFTAGQEFIEASFGVQRVNRSTRGAGGRFTGSKPGSRIYPLWVHEGTGLYGRLHRLIRPKRKKAMVFVGRTGLVITKSVKGQRPQPYMTEAYMDARAYIDAHLDDMLGRLFR